MVKVKVGYSRLMMMKAITMMPSTRRKVLVPSKISSQAHVNMEPKNINDAAKLS